MGPPAVGKLTVARALAARTGAAVVDNHLVNDAVFVPLGLGVRKDVRFEDTDVMRDRVRDVVLEATIAAPADLSHVFTVWLPEDPENAAHVERMRRIAAQRRARFVPVLLTASRESLLERVTAASRAERRKIVDAEILAPLIELPDVQVEGALVIDTDASTPEETVQSILEAIA